MLMDEPFGAVDPITRDRLQDEFLRIQQDIKKTIVFVTHDIDEAIKMGDKIAILKQGGVLAQYDTPENILSRPDSEFVSSFVGGDRVLKRLSLTRVGEMDLEPANGGTDDLLRISGGLSVKDALSELIGSGHSRAVVEGDGENGLLTFAAIEDLMGGASGQVAQRRGDLGVSNPALLLLQDLTGGPELIDWEWLRENFWEDIRAGPPGAHLPLVRFRSR